MATAIYHHRSAAAAYHDPHGTPLGRCIQTDTSTFVFILKIGIYFYKTALNTVVLFFRSNTLPSRRTLKNSRLVCKKDDVHVCIMCLRAIMNYQVIRLWSVIFKEHLNWKTEHNYYNLFSFSLFYITHYSAEVWLQHGYVPSTCCKWNCSEP